MKNNQKGITLIALVVTIIVLLILAGVSIAMLTGQNGILNRASEASYQTKLQNAAESMSYNVTEAITDYYNKNYVNNTASGETTVAAAIVSGITSSMSASSSPSTAKSDTSVTVTLGAGIDTSGKTITEGDTATVTLSYGGYKKVGTVTTSAGISWDEIEKE